MLQGGELMEDNSGPFLIPMCQLPSHGNWHVMHKDNWRDNACSGHTPAWIEAIEIKTILESKHTDKQGILEAQDRALGKLRECLYLS